MKTIILSDCHIGSPEANVSKLNKFLTSVECDRLIFAGDFWDLWDKSVDDIRKDHAVTMDILRKLAAKGVKMEYLIGNHDESYLKNPVMPLTELPVISKFEENLPDGRKIAIIHGHEYDFIYKNYYWFYRALDFINTLAKKTVGISNVDFGKRKTVTNLTGKEYSDTILKIHNNARKAYKKRGFNYLIMGHTHAPMNIEDSNKLCGFCNSGDWKIHNSYAVIDGSTINLCRIPN